MELRWPGEEGMFSIRNANGWGSTPSRHREGPISRCPGGKPGQVQGTSKVNVGIVFSTGLGACVHVRADLEARSVQPLKI
jgi:hypothetical protein